MLRRDTLLRDLRGRGIPANVAGFHDGVRAVEEGDFGGPDPGHLPQGGAGMDGGDAGLHRGGWEGGFTHGAGTSNKPKCHRRCFRAARRLVQAGRCRAAAISPIADEPGARCAGGAQGDQRGCRRERGVPRQRRRMVHRAAAGLLPRGAAAAPPRDPVAPAPRQCAASEHFSPIEMSDA